MTTKIYMLGGPISIGGPTALLRMETDHEAKDTKLSKWTDGAWVHRDDLFSVYLSGGDYEEVDPTTLSDAQLK